ncbi:MAG: 30S ribosomal protein S20 [Candidatus Hydrothermota bacterium]|nr:MAG: 30S ribosomal protein S20 [Candidatus Hydrothermae bacterium]
MAKTLSSAEKRHKQSEKRRLRNKSYKSFIKTLTKKFLKEEDAEKKKLLLSQLYEALDKAVSKGILHKNTVARRKRKAALIYNEFLKRMGG